MKSSQAKRKYTKNNEKHHVRNPLKHNKKVVLLASMQNFTLYSTYLFTDQGLKKVNARVQ